MMGTIGAYFFSLITGALVCGVLMSITSKGMFRGLMKLLCGLYLTVALVYPLTNFDFSSLSVEWSLSDFQEGEAIAAIGKANSDNLLASRIKQETEEYILDKADALGLSLSVVVSLSDSDIPVPVSVQLYGTAEETARQRLTSIITEELGISKENQLWTEGNSAKN